MGLKPRKRPLSRAVRDNLERQGFPAPSLDEYVEQLPPGVAETLGKVKTDLEEAVEILDGIKLPPGWELASDRLPTCACHWCPRPAKRYVRKKDSFSEHLPACYKHPPNTSLYDHTQNDTKPPIQVDTVEKFVETFGDESFVPAGTGHVPLVRVNQGKKVPYGWTLLPDCPLPQKRCTWCPTPAIRVVQSDSERAEGERRGYAACGRHPEEKGRIYTAEGYLPLDETPFDTMLGVQFGDNPAASLVVPDLTNNDGSPIFDGEPTQKVRVEVHITYEVLDGD